jgi:hypothetical protein
MMTSGIYTLTSLSLNGTHSHFTPYNRNSQKKVTNKTVPQKIVELKFDCLLLCGLCTTV